MLLNIQIDQVLEFFEKGTPPQDKQQNKIAAEIFWANHLAKEKELASPLELKNWYFEELAKSLDIPELKGHELKGIMVQCISKIKFSNYDSAKDPEAAIHFAPRFKDYDKDKGAIRSGYRDLNLGGEVTGRGMYEILHPENK